MNGKKCKCGRKYTADQWLDLKPLGLMVDTQVSMLDLRNCFCGSTMAVTVAVYIPMPVVRLGTAVLR